MPDSYGTVQWRSMRLILSRLFPRRPPTQIILKCTWEMRCRAFSTSPVAYFSAVSKNSNIEFLFSPVARLRKCLCKFISSSKYIIWDFLFWRSRKYHATCDYLSTYLRVLRPNLISLLFIRSFLIASLPLPDECWKTTSDRFLNNHRNFC